MFESAFINILRLFYLVISYPCYKGKKLVLTK